MIVRRDRCSFVLVTALVCGLSTVAYAEVHVEGSLAAVRVTTKQDAISDVLAAFAATFNVKYRTAVRLDAPANATYAGSFGQVISRLLDGYSYVMRKDQEAIEIVVFGKHGAAAVPPPAAKSPPPQDILSRWR